MNYSNGLNIDLVAPALADRRGWSQPTQTNFTPVLSSDVKKCTSGRFYNLEHAACSPVSIYANQEDARISQANFNTFLVDLKKQVALESLMSVFTEPELIEPSKIMFDKLWRTNFIDIPNSGKFCGHQFKIAQGDFATAVVSIMLVMSGPCTVTLYAYSDMKAASFWTKEISVTEGYNQQIENITDLILSQVNDTYKGGVVYVGYYQDELEAQGVTAQDISLAGYTSYNMVANMSFEATANYEAKTFVRNMYMSNRKTYGLNMELSTSRDHTENAIRNAQIFDNLQGLIMRKKCIELAMNSPRTNGDNRLARESYEMLYNEIEGLKGGEGIPYRQGLKDKIAIEIKKIHTNFFPPLAPIDSIPPVNTNTLNNYQNPKFGTRP